jgi:sortase (surface protein transpeptidase)
MKRIGAVGLLALGAALIVAALLALPDDGPDAAGTTAEIEAALRPPTTTISPPPVAPDDSSQVPPVVDTTATPAPDPAAPTSDDSGGGPEPASAPPATVAPEPAAVPVGLRIGALDVDAPVGAYGVDADRQMDVPDNVTEVAWYEYGPTPGQAGSAVLAAHVDLAGQGPGVFFGLRTLEPGDLVEVSYADGSAAAFRVVARTVYDKDELPTDVIFSRQGPPVLTLITCGGGFSRSSRTYDSNVVVYTVPVVGDELPAVGAVD